MPRPPSRMLKIKQTSVTRRSTSIPLSGVWIASQLVGSLRSVSRLTYVWNYCTTVVRWSRWWISVGIIWTSRRVSTLANIYINRKIIYDATWYKVICLPTIRWTMYKKYISSSVLSIINKWAEAEVKVSCFSGRSSPKQQGMYSCSYKSKWKHMASLTKRT